MEAQAAFRKNMGTIDNILVLHGVINYMLNKIRNYMNIFLPIGFNICFGCYKEPSH